MRLINARTHELVEFFDADIPPYAILSHKWGSPDDEISYSDYVKDRKRDTAGRRKIDDFCRVAAELNYGWVWVDTCCIDKSSSSEQSEAINSMFAWYKAAQLCVVHLNDVTDPDDLESFGRSVWFTRGWTLQELLAPATLTWYTADWQIIGSKDSPTHAMKVSHVTGIPQRMLKSPDILHNVSVARRMSWAAKRQTSRTEDLAYCLLGIFNINMPLLYGEGGKAFYRLQMEIMDQLDDESLFAWQDDPSTAESATHGLLAKSPSKFASCGNIVATQTPSRMESPPIRMTSRGAEVFSELSETYSITAERQPIFVYTLGCGTTEHKAFCLDNLVGADLLREGKVRPCSIALIRKSEGASFTRIDAGTPISDLVSKYMHASYVRPSRFYIQTTWSGAATFARIFTGKRPRAHSPDKVTRQADRLAPSLSVSAAPYRSFSTRAKLTALREEGAIKVLTGSHSTPLERKSSDPSDLDMTPVTSTESKTETANEYAERWIQSAEEFNYADPEFLQTDGISRSKSRRKQHTAMPTVEENNVPLPSTQDEKVKSFSQEEVEAEMDRLRPLLDNLSTRFDSPVAADRKIVGVYEFVDSAQEGASPVNSDPEAETVTGATREHTVQMTNADVSPSAEPILKTRGPVDIVHGLQPKKQKNEQTNKQYPEPLFNLSDIVNRYNRPRSTGDDRSRSSSASPSPDSSKTLHRKRRNSSIKTALQAVESIDDVRPGSSGASPSGLGFQDSSSSEGDKPPITYWVPGSMGSAAVKSE